MSSQVVELHCHSHYSPMDGLSTPAEYMARAKEIGMPAIAATDHGTHAVHHEWYHEAKKAGIVPILGNEMYVSPTDMYDRRSKAKREDGTDVYNHIIALATGDDGLDTLNRLSRKAWEEGYYFKPRVDSDLILSDNEGLIFLSGCLNGLWAKAIERGEPDEAIRLANLYKEALGDRFYIEVQGSNPAEINHGLLEIADKCGIAPVVTSDCHYARKEDLWVEEAFLILSTNPKKNPDFDLSRAQKMDVLDRYNYLYPDRKMTFQDIEIYLRDRETHEQLFHKQGIYRTDIYDNTNVIASRIADYNMPSNLDLLPATSDDPDATLRKMAFEGLAQRGFGDDPRYVERLEHELKVIKDMEFARYFIVVEDVVSWSLKRGILLGPGRGSAAGSLLCYALHITHVDPIEYGLIFERFLDPSRKGDWPDIDIDWPDSRRGEVKDYLRRRYGNVASIATFNTFGGKSAITDAARVFGVPPAEVKRATKDNEAPDGADYFDHFSVDPQSREFASRYPEVIALAREISGRIRGTGIHASGVVVANRPIEEIAPVQTGKDPNDSNGERINYIAVDMNIAAKIGLIKLDVLGLKTLSVLESTRRMVKERHGVDIDFYNMPLDDPEVYKQLRSGHNVGIFQAEGAALKKWLMDSRCEEFNDIVAGTAIARPGPMNTIGPIYKQRLKGGGFHIENHKERAIVGETMGLPIYQEQVMKYMTEIGGMTPVESNAVRRIIGKKKTDQASKELMDEYREKFIEGARKELGTTRAKKLWSDFERWSGYGFNLSHSVAYSMITYWTAWVKYHYPLEFIVASMQNTKDVDKIANLVIESRRLGLKMKLPHVNHSDVGTSIRDDQILLGLSGIKYISDLVAQKIIKERPFSSAEHFRKVAETKGSGINSRAVGSANSVGAITFEDNPMVELPPAETLYEVLSLPAVADVGWIDKSKIRSLDEFDSDDTFVALAIYRGKGKSGKGWMIAELIDESGAEGMFADPEMEIIPGKTYLFLISRNRIVRAVEPSQGTPGESPLERYTSGKLPEPSEGNHIPVAFTPRKTKAGKMMATMVVVNHLGKMEEVVIFPQYFYFAYEQCKGGEEMALNLTEKEDGSLIFNGTRSSED